MNTCVNNDDMEISTYTDDIPLLSSRECKYQFRRGRNKGQCCRQTITRGGDYCTECRNKIVTDSTINGPRLSVVVFDLDKNLYRDPEHGFIINSKNGETVAIGQLVDNEIIPLSEGMKKIACSMSLSYVE